jgi:hypothetical protein
MVNPVKTFLIKLTKKCVISLLIGLLTLAAYGLWLFIQDPGNVAEQRSRVIAATELELSQLKSEQVQLDTAKREASTTLAAQQARRQQAEKSLKTLHQLDPSLWERIFGDAETQQRQQTWVARMDQVKAEAVARSVELQRQLREIDSRWQALSERLQAVEQTHLAAVADRQAVVYYLQRSWIEARWLAAGVILVFLFAVFLRRGPPGGAGPSGPVFPGHRSAPLGAGKCLVRRGCALAGRGFAHPPLVPSGQ